MNLKEFKKLSIDKQNEIIKDIKHKYINELKNHECISKELNIVQSTIRKIKELLIEIL